MQIKCVERVIIATASIPKSRELWMRAGFAVSPEDFVLEGSCFARLATGAVEIDLCSRAKESQESADDFPAVQRENGILGWVWGVDSVDARSNHPLDLPGPGMKVTAHRVEKSLPGVMTAVLAIDFEQIARSDFLHNSLGENPNTVQYLEHIVVMTPNLEDAIATHQALGVVCKRIREVGNGTRQAFFKLEQTVIEVVGPTSAQPGCWGLAFMCSDIHRAVAIARSNGLEATEPKKAIQGGLIARIVEPLDGVAVAFMQSA